MLFSSLSWRAWCALATSIFWDSVRPSASATSLKLAPRPSWRQRARSARRHLVNRPIMWAGRRIVADVLISAWRIDCLIQ